MTLGENLQDLHRAVDLSQEEVAGKLFVSRQSVSKWENDQAEVDIFFLWCLFRRSIRDYFHVLPEKEGNS